MAIVLHDSVHDSAITFGNTKKHSLSCSTIREVTLQRGDAIGLCKTLVDEVSREHQEHGPPCSVWFNQTFTRSKARQLSSGSWQLCSGSLQKTSGRLPKTSGRLPAGCRKFSAGCQSKV